MSISEAASSKYFQFPIEQRLQIENLIDPAAIASDLRRLTENAR